MTIKKTLIAVLAVAVAAAFSPIPELQAAAFNPGSQVDGSSLVQTIQAKKKQSAKKKSGKKKSGKKAGKKKKGKGKKGASKSCGTYMYKKGGKCVDARNKK